MTQTVPNMGDVIRAYMKLRNQKDAIEAATKEQLTAVKGKMEKLEAYIKSELDAQGLNTFKSDYGTAFLTTTDFANVADWDAALTFVLENEAYDMLEKRISKTAVRGYIDTHKTVPPGVNYGTKVEVNIRKPTKKITE
jgi:hypothetical protein